MKRQGWCKQQLRLKQNSCNSPPKQVTGEVTGDLTEYHIRCIRFDIPVKSPTGAQRVAFQTKVVDEKVTVLDEL